jgi:hypothetical protein
VDKLIYLESETYSEVKTDEKINIKIQNSSKCYKITHKQKGGNSNTTKQCRTIICIPLMMELEMVSETGFCPQLTQLVT